MCLPELPDTFCLPAANPIFAEGVARFLQNLQNFAAIARRPAEVAAEKSSDLATAGTAIEFPTRRTVRWAGRLRRTGARRRKYSKNASSA